MAIVCPTCRAVYVDGTLFCDQCGNWLIGVAAQPDEEVDGPQEPTSNPATETLPTRVGSTGAISPSPASPASSRENSEDMPWLQPVPGWDQPLDLGKETSGTLPLPQRGDVESGKLPSPGTGPSRLRVLVLNTGRLSEWLDDALIQVGRTDRSVNVFPQIDLEVDGGHNAGVSRRHVKIHRYPDGYVVEDLGSINGTFLNRRRLSPGTTAELRDGDELRVGNIVLRVQLGGYNHGG